MLDLHSADVWRTILLSVIAVGQTLFVVLYVTFPWWKSFLGRALFSKAFALMILIDFIALGRITGYARDDRVFVMLYSLLAVGVWAEVVVFLRVKYRGGESM